MLYTFLVISFALYKEYMIFLISLSKVSDGVPAFTCARAIGNLWSICLGVKIFRPFASDIIQEESLNNLTTASRDS